jgi:arginyl-tRNA synthetase
MGHYSTNAALRLVREQSAVRSAQLAGKQKAPIEIAKELVKKIEKAAPKEFFSKIEAVPPGFINFWISDGTIKKELAAIVKNEAFGTSHASKGKTVIVEYSQPNIAKKMHVGHLRTTVIGDALANMHEALGYKVIRWNYLGDWGTQFGKLIAAYRMWGPPAVRAHQPDSLRESERAGAKRAGTKERIGQDFIQTLLDLYIRFHDELKYRPELEEMGRAEFKKLEEGDKENRALWKWFKDESLKEFKRIYKMLGITFDVWIGESFFEPQMVPLIEELVEKGIATVSGDALIVNLEKYNLPSALVQKSDGTSLYLTRDIANIRYRLQEYKPAKILYVVGNEQTLHFEQLFRVAEIMDLGKSVELVHVKYGLVLAEEGKKFATREGRVIFLEEVIEKAVRLAYEVVEKKSQRSDAPTGGRSSDFRRKVGTSEKKKIANTVAIGALKYTNLRENRHSDIRFDWGKMLDFAGDSGPYLQYTFARLMSVVRKAGDRSEVRGESMYLEAEDELGIVRKMIEFPDAVTVAAETYAPNHLCNYLYELAVAANKFYESTPILSDENKNRRNARLLLVTTVADVLEKGLGLLGIDVLEKI